MKTLRKILIVSNDLTLFRRLENFLTEEGYRVLYAQSTDNRLKSILEETCPDLVVVDPETPSLKGIEISLLIRQWSPVPILMLSTASSEGNEVRALNLESGDYLSEPIDIHLVAARIEQVLSLSTAS